MKKYILSAYQKISIASIFLILVGILWYVAAIILTIDGIGAWGAPVVLSPSQEKVLSFQPQLASIESSLIKQKIDLVTAESTVKSVTIQLENIIILQAKLNLATKIEADQLSNTGRLIANVLVDKHRDIEETKRTVSDAKFLLTRVNQELEAGLITTDQAAQRRVSLQSALNNSTDAKSQQVLLQYQSRQLTSGSKTLLGEASSLSALTSIKLNSDLQATSEQLKIQLATVKSTVNGLEYTIAESQRILDVAKITPYYRALRGEVTVAFFPYGSYNNANVGDPIYDCVLTILICSTVGTISKMYDAEEYARHPFLKTDLKGKFAEIEFTKKQASKSLVVFIGHSPLFF